MDKNSSDESYCKFVLCENGRAGLVRRIQFMTVQAADGRLYKLEKKRLPETIVLYTATPNEKATAEVLLQTPPAPSVRKVVSSFMNGTRARDIAFTLLGMLIITVLITVADCIIQLASR